MASQSQVSTPSATNPQSGAPSNTPSITKESFLQRARAAALRGKQPSNSPTSSRAYSPSGSVNGSSQQVPPTDGVPPAQTGQTAHGEGAPASAPRYGSILNAPSWNVAEASSAATEQPQTSPSAPGIPGPEAMELDELQDLKADQRQSSPDSVEFIQETGPTQQRRKPVASSTTAPAPESSASAGQPAVPAAAAVDRHSNLAQDSPSAAVDDQLELPRVDDQAPANGLSNTGGSTSGSVAEETTSDPSQPALFGEPSPLLPLIQSFSPDSRRIAIRSFETLPEDLRRKVLNNPAMMNNFKAYVMTNLVPSQQQAVSAASGATTAPSTSNQQVNVAATTAQSASIQQTDATAAVPVVSSALGQQHAQAQQVQQVHPTAQTQHLQATAQAQQQPLSTAASRLDANAGSTQPPNMSEPLLDPALRQPQQRPSLPHLQSSNYTQSTAQQHSPVILQSPVAFQQSPGLSHASVIQSSAMNDTPVIVQAAPQQYGPAVPPLMRQAPLDQTGLTAGSAASIAAGAGPTAGQTVSTALMAVGGMENRLGAWTQGLYEDVRQNLVAPLEAALRETEKQRDQWKLVAENNSNALAQLLGGQANSQWQARLAAVNNELSKVRSEKDRLNQLYQASLQTHSRQTSQIGNATAAYQELERKFNDSRKQTLTIMTGFETLKKQNEELQRQKQSWSHAGTQYVAMQQRVQDLQRENTAMQQRVQELQQERTTWNNTTQLGGMQKRIEELERDRLAFANESNSKDAKVETLEKQVEELKRDREVAIKVMQTEAEKWKVTADQSLAQERESAAARGEAGAVRQQLTAAREQVLQAHSTAREVENRLKEAECRANNSQLAIVQLERQMKEKEKSWGKDAATSRSKITSLERQLKATESEVQDYKQQFESLRTTAQAKINEQHETITKLRERNQRYKEVVRQSTAGSSPALKRALPDSQASQGSPSQRPRQ